MLQNQPASGPPPAKQRKPRKPRGRGLRTTTGCAVCRRRHMKCDEVKPICGPCAKGNRPCVYGVSKPSSSTPTSDGEASTSTAPIGAYPSDTARRASDGQIQELGYDAVVPAQSHWTVPQPTAGSIAALDSSHHPPTQDGSISNPSPSGPIWTPSFEDTQAITSPQSAFSFNSEVAPFRWFGLLADDADMEREGLQDRKSSLSDTPVPSYHTSQLQLRPPRIAYPPPLVPLATPRSPMPAVDENELWQSPTGLMDHEIPLFRKFVDQLSGWLDLFDPLKHFGSLVPQLAMNNEGILKAILALSARHLSIKSVEHEGTALDRTAAVQYYNETLQYLQRAMKYDSYTKSEEILATALIVSTYEMIDGAGQSWERHLKGVFWIQWSQDNNGESGGLRQAVWWAWIRQDIWAAFREKRRCFSSWRPSKPYHQMDHFEIASRAMYVLARIVDYSSDEETSTAENNLQQRIEKADHLMNLLDDWHQNLSVHFKPLPLATNTVGDGPFKPIWIHPPACAAAIQMHHLSYILLLIHRPATGGFREYLNREQQLIKAVDTIVGVALTVTDDAASIISTQCLFAAGLYCHDDAKREVILGLLEDSQKRTGWPVSNLGDELKTEWAKVAASS